MKWLRALARMGQRRRAYKLTFGSPAGQQVLEDLIKFCRACETCYHQDARAHAVLEGRREVWLRIQNHLGLSDEQLMILYSGLSGPDQTKENDDG